MGRMIEDLEEFSRGLNQAQRILNGFNVEFANKIGTVKERLDSLSNLTQALRLPEDAPSAELVNGEIREWQDILTACGKKAQENFKGEDFQKRFEKSPLVIVFGIVKAGKSTLGNFIHGRSFRAASFSNPYTTHAIPDSKIHVEESGRPDEREKTDFDENSIESTCSAQYFEVPGLVWVDTPGIGAIQKAADLQPLEKIAKKYVQYADLVVFLANSTNPGINEDVAGYKSLYESGKKALVIITRSDKSQTEIRDGKLIRTSDGKPSKILVPKDLATRKLQEDALRAAMEKNGIPGRDCEAVSISTRLAEMAVEKNDDALWTGSNVGALYRKIVDVIGNEEILEIKKSAPRKLLNKSIDGLVGDAKTEDSLAALLANIESLKLQIAEKFDSLNPQGTLVGEIVEDVVNAIRGPLRKHIDEEVSRQSSSDKMSISLEALQSSIQKMLMNTLEQRVKRLVGAFRRDVLGAFSLSGMTTTAVRKTATETYQVDVPYRVPRPPSGIIEHIRGFFGKSYSRTIICKEDRHFEVDLGVDTSAAKVALLKQVEEGASKYVRSELEELRKSFFGTTLEKIGELEHSVTRLVADLKAVRY